MQIISPDSLAQEKAPKPTGSQPSSALFSIAFRPFFAVAALGSILLMFWWLLMYNGIVPLNHYYGWNDWHAHEMLFGYGLAVVAGFLLTASRSWTGLKTLAGWPLAGLVLLWIAGRMVPLFALPPALIAAVDLALVPLLGIEVTRVVVKSRNKRNYFYIPLLTALFVANLIIHLDKLGILPGAAQYAVLGTVYLLVLLNVFIGGRIIPFFTGRAINGANPISRRPIEIAGYVLLAGCAFAALVPLPPLVVVPLALAAALVHLTRMLGWFNKKLLMVPLLWILHAGYLWLVVGFVLQAVAALGLIPRSVYIHAFTAGMLGANTLGMMARVSLGHSGRPLIPPRPVILAFVLILTAALIRVAIPPLFPFQILLSIKIAGGLWMAAFALYLMRYLMILIEPRPDGKSD